MEPVRKIGRLYEHRIVGWVTSTMSILRSLLETCCSLIKRLVDCHG
jgi:hypothetical protein